MNGESTAASPNSASRNATCLQIYSATNVLGVGVFTLPFLLPTVGLLPAIVVPYVLGMVMSPLYQRLVPDQSVMRRGANDTKRPTLGGQVREIGGGRAASNLGRLAAALRGVPTVLAYLAIGQSAIEMIHRVVGPLGSSKEIFGVVLVVSMGGPLLQTRAAIAGTVLRLLRFWALGLLIVDLAEPAASRSSLVLVLAVVAGVIDMGSHGNGRRARARALGGLRPEHSSAVGVLLVQLVTMAVVAAIAVVVVVLRSELEAPPLFVIPDAEALVIAVGVALFSLTGTGYINTATYPIMRAKTGIARVIGGSLRIVVVAQAVWLLAVAATVPLGELTDLDAAKSFSTVGIADAVTVAMPTLGRILQVVGALLILFGLSSASHGTTESLAIEFTAERADLTRRLQIATVVALAGTSVALRAIEITATGIIAVSGLGGGVLIMFVLPILAEVRADLRRLRRNQAMSAVVAVMTLAAVGAALAGSTSRLAAIVALALVVLGWIIQTTHNIRNHESNTDTITLRGRSGGGVPLDGELVVEGAGSDL